MKTKETLINQFREVHGDKYNYDSMIYRNIKIKILIRCPQHGLFEQFVANHLKGHGCKDCYFETQMFEQKEVIAKFKEVHGDAYDYSDMDYQGMSKKIKIRCKVHGIFEQKAQNHLNGAGCMSCYKDKLEQKKEEKKKHVFEVCKQLFGERYDYSESVYQSNEVPFTVVCKEHGAFNVTPRAHMLGVMCKACKEDDKAWWELVKKRKKELNVDELKENKK